VLPRAHHLLQLISRVGGVLVPQRELQQRQRTTAKQGVSMCTARAPHQVILRSGWPLGLEVYLSHSVSCSSDNVQQQSTTKESQYQHVYGKSAEPVTIATIS
jgi:hypothetical protein